MPDEKELGHYRIDPNAPQADENHPWLSAMRSAFDMLGGGQPDAGLSPIAGLSLKNPANIDKLLKMMANDTGKGAYSPNAKQAFAFLKAKYPKIFGIPTSVRETDIVRKPRWGEYNPHFRDVRVAPRPNAPIDSLVSTTGHELTHAIQQKRGAWNTFADYQKAGAYHQNPFEIDAERGGETAKTAYEQFMEMLNNPQK